MFAICLINWNLSYKSLLYSDIRYPSYLKSVTCSIILSFITIFTLCMWFLHDAIGFVFVLDMVIWYFLATRFKCYSIVCNSSSDVAIKIWSSAYSMVFTDLLLFSCMPFFITILNSYIILLMAVLNNTGERPHPCLIPLFVEIGSYIPSLNLILTFVFL